ncbi:hypothetical protein ACFQU3_23720 [Terrabacter sp. GCM10028922]|jgi:hypothetical protein
MTALTPPKGTDDPDWLHPAACPAATPDLAEVLSGLGEAMTLARRVFMAARRPPAGPMQLKNARDDYLATMLAYEQALTVMRLPVPPRLRDEVRLLRRLTPLPGGRR